MSLAGQTIWVVGGVGVVGRGIARGLLQAGATVIVNSRSPDRLERIVQELKAPERLIAHLGSLKPEFAQDTVNHVLNKDSAGDDIKLNHVVAHGAVRYWTQHRAGCDETFSLRPNISFLEQSSADFMAGSSILASYHFAAAQALLPKLMETSLKSNSKHKKASYTFVTGDGSGHPSSIRTPMGELNSHHVWGLAAALRRELKENPAITIRELRIGMPIHANSIDARALDRRLRPISEDIGDLCAGLIVSDRTDDQESVIRLDSGMALDTLLVKYRADKDKDIGPLPSISEFAGSL